MAKPKGRRGPVCVVKVGSVSVPIYSQKSASCTSGVVYKLDYQQAGKRMRPCRADLEEAKELAKEVAEKISQLGSNVSDVTPEQRVLFARALETIQPSGLTIDDVAAQFMAATVLVRPSTIMEAAKFFVANQPGKGAQNLTVAAAVDQFLHAKADSGRSIRHLKDLRLRLGVFARVFSCSIAELRLDAILNWINKMTTDGRPISGRSKNNYLQVVGSFVDYARGKGWVSPLLSMRMAPRANEAAGTVQIFSPSEMRRLLQSCRPEVLPFVAIGGFAGLRSAEIERMHWRQIHFETDNHYPHGWIELRADQSKNAAKMGARARRLIPMSGNLRAWLEPLRREPGAQLMPFVKSEHHLAKLAEASGVPWKRNGLRHSFGSYRLAQTHDEAKVALEMGNSPAMIFAHYRQLVSPAQAEEWFTIAPDKHDEKVIPFQSAAAS